MVYFLEVIQLLEEKRIGKKDFIIIENYHILLNMNEEDAVMMVISVRTLDYWKTMVRDGKMIRLTAQMIQELSS